MKDEFEYGELVEVRSREDLEWRARVYAGTMEHTELHWCMKDGQDKTTYNGRPVPWLQIRKIQPDPIEEVKSPETNITKEEELRLRDDAIWAIGQAVEIGHREYGEVLRAAKLLIDVQVDLIKHIKEKWTD